MTGPHTILIVEDSDATRVYMERALASEGYEIVSAASVTDGRALIESQAIDLALEWRRDGIAKSIGVVANAVDLLRQV